VNNTRFTVCHDIGEDTLLTAIFQKKTRESQCENVSRMLDFIGSKDDGGGEW